MGSLGSTRWLGHRKKRTVEACLSLDISQLLSRLQVSAASHSSGTLKWVHPHTDEPLGSCAYEVDTTNREHAWLCLRFEYRRPGNPPVPVLVRVTLTATAQFFGGLRWWGICPLGCGRRIRKVYLPPTEQSFGCRRCHNLTYRTCQESHLY